METTPKISVIVPAYNVEKYLDECVQSVLSQDYGNFELVLVDDGSTDSTPAICDKYAAQDSRVRVVHQANGGRSEARNGALRVVTGDYVANLDGDDTYLPQALSNISQKIVQCHFPDLVLGRFSAYTVDDSFTAKDVELDEARIDWKTTSELLDYEDATMFDILAEELARRDLEGQDVDGRESDTLQSRIGEYLAEFDQHGLDNVYTEGI